MNLGTSELLILFAVVILLFGAKKLPELARGSGRALRIFKEETKGLPSNDTQGITHPAPPKQANTTGGEGHTRARPGGGVT